MVFYIVLFFLLDYSCALIADILLQGHLYISPNYFAFYSNVFGYVTKLLIPTSSVVQITKEKTAYMFPNAIGVTTLDDRHVFGSFLSRENAFQLMNSVWKKNTESVVPVEGEPATDAIDIEVSEYSLDSSSIDETPAEEAVVPIKILCPADILLLNTSNPQTSKVELEKPGANEENIVENLALVETVEPRRTESIFMNISNIPYKLMNYFHLLYIGIAIAVLLALFSGVLLLKINTFQTRQEMHSGGHILNNNHQDTSVYSEWIKYQSQIQAKNIQEASQILNQNLAEVIKVRKNLEELQHLLHNSFAKYPNPNERQKQEF